MSRFKHQDIVKNIVTLTCCLSALGAVSPTHAAPASFGSNAYEFVYVGTSDYFSASSAAAASVFNGVNGHLATITSQAENDFILGLVTTTYTGFNGAWLGGNYQGWLQGPESGLTFIQVGGYTNWNPVEPNNSGFTYMSIGTFTPNSGSSGGGKWLDDSGTQGFPDAFDAVVGYFVEYENASVGAVPEPENYAMLLAGLGLLGFIARRNK